MRLFYLFVLATHLIADEWNGRDYAQNSTVQSSHAELLLRTISFCGDETICDVGCGDGKITKLLAKNVPQGMVIGIDPSLDMLSKAEEKTCDNLQFLLGSAEDFSSDYQFDHIFAIHVMHWIKEQKAALQNIYAHLKPNGQVHFILAPSKEGLPFARALKTTMDAWSSSFAGFENPQQVFDMESYRKIMVDAGFHIEQIHYVSHKSTHPNKEALRLWIKQWLPHGKFLDKTEQDAFLQELIDQYLIESKQCSNESIAWEEYVLFIEASKTH